MSERCKDNNWTINRNTNGTYSYEGAQLAVLMDLRDEMQEQSRSLRRLVAVMECPNTRRGFLALIEMNKRRKRALKKRRKA